MALKKRKKTAAAPGPAAEAGEPADGGGDEHPQAKYVKKGQAAEGDHAKASAQFNVPDAAEVLEIAQTQNLYKSNLFRLQIEELVRELAPKPSHASVESFLRALKEVLEGLKPREIPAGYAEEFPELCFHQRHPYPFSFKPPKRIDVVGSFLLGTCVRSDLSVDVALEMPSECFQAKDYVNWRYSDKRAAYVGELHRQLSASRKGGGPLADLDLHLEALQGDLYRPCVALQAKGKAGEAAWVVRLLPTYAAELFAPSKLAPDRNLVRPAGTDAAELSAKVVAALPPTAHYNSCVLEDARMRTHLEYLHKMLAKMPALRDAILLMKRWAQARNFLPAKSTISTIFTPLSGFCLSMLAAHASQTSNLAPSSTSSFQIFKLAMGVLANTDWRTQKVVLGKATPAALSDAEAAQCGAHFHDGDGLQNFFWRLGPFIAEISSEAQRTLKTLDAEADPFDAVFGQVSSPELLWDLVVSSQPLSAGALSPEFREKTVPRFEGPRPADEPEALALGERLKRVLAAGLGDRCKHVAVRLVGSSRARWPKGGERPSGGAAVFVGLTLEALHLDRALDRGPSAQDEAEVAKFTSLWGKQKTEMRRFKDGSILKCVVWSRPPAAQQVESKKSPAIVTQIVRHLLEQHFPKMAKGADVVAGPLGFVQNLGERERRLWGTFEQFRTHLCQLSSLPLSIKDVHAADEDFSYTALLPGSAPAAGDNIPRTLHSVVVEFESSGRWPDDPMAQRKVAGALLLSMREELLSDLGIESDVTEEFLDVRYPEVVFRVRIFHAHEFTAAAHRVTNFQVQHSAALPSAETLDRLRTLWWRPRICAAMHAQVLIQPALAGASRLVKRWMASQLLSGYDDFVEHLVAKVFVQPRPFQAPTSLQVGFCRICWLLDSFDWESEPLIIDFDGKLREEERLSIRQSFEKGRSEAAGSTFFWIATRFDPHAILLKTPPATVSAWLRARARQALGCCHRRLLGLDRGGWQPLFALDTSIFDVTVRLAPAASADDAASKGKKGAKVAHRQALAQREAFQGFVEKLRAHLSPVCLVFSDTDGRLVALKWRPSAFFPQPQNVLMGAVPHTMIAQPKDKPVLCVPNVLCLTAAIASLAEGLAIDVSLVGMRG